MNEKTKTILVGVGALIVGAVGGAGYGMMQVDDVTKKLAATTLERDQATQSADRLRKMTEDGVKKYGAELGKLVAAPVSDDPAKVIDSARAILAIRDNFRASLDGVRASMDSDFDSLAAELGAAAPNPDKVKQLLDNIKQAWPEKAKGMDDATRKLLVDLGVVQAPAAPKPAAAPAPAAAPVVPAPATPEKK